MNRQITDETYASYLYLSMALYFERENYDGFAHWMHLQSQEEASHAAKFMNHIHERGGVVKLEAIEAPKHEWNSPLEVFEEALAHEKLVTASIVKIMDEAVAAKDYASISLLHWFIDEQVEEEDTAQSIVDRLKRCNNHIACVMAIDSKLGQRQAD